MFSDEPKVSIHLPLASLFKVKLKVHALIIRHGLHAKVFRGKLRAVNGAAVVRPEDAALLVFLHHEALWELDPVGHRGQELLGKGEDPLVLLGLVCLRL